MNWIGGTSRLPTSTGASPDGIVRCECCALGVLEIKCPFSCRNKSFAEASSDNTQFCLVSNQQDGTFKLKDGHAYYYQVQAQMKLAGASYCDFAVWSPDKFVVLRIDPADDFIAQAFEKATAFFKFGILPELVRKWYTKAPVYRCALMTTEGENAAAASTNSSETDITTQEDDEAWCYCRGKDEGEMIFCESNACPIGWFHTKCLKLSIIPRGKWFCPNCRVTQKRDKK